MIDGRYFVQQELGRGGIGTVYLARDKPELMSRRVVVKVLHEDSLKNEWIVQKFRQEVESLTRLDDPGVVGIIDAGTLEDGSPYLVMQFVEGASLRRQLGQGVMSFERVAAVMRQAGRTLEVAHASGIIHRDLKPENIMLRTAAGGDVQVKVIDFGIAKVKNSVVAPSTVTGARAVGTIAYMSPEQLSARKVTPASDIYALGVVAYEMLTGTRPFNPETSFELLEMQREGVRVTPKDLRPALPEAAQEVILKALAFEPQGRYGSAREFGDALALALLDEPETSEASTLSVREVVSARPSVGAPAQSRVPAAFVVLCVAVLLSTLLLWALWGRGRADTKLADSNAAAAGPPPAERVFTYYLAPADKGVLSEDRFTGNEQFHNGSKFRFVLTPEQPGALYLLDRGSGPKQTESWSVLFPTPKNNNGSSRVESNQAIEARINFDPNPGSENLSIIWAAQPVAELETIFRDAAKTDFEIRDPAQVAAVKEFLTRHGSTEPRSEVDVGKNQTTVRGSGDIFIRRIVLKHFDF
jgi:serine/threonine protein kinase